MLTPTQYATLKADILANATLAALVSTAEGGMSSGPSQDGTLLAAINGMTSGTILQAAVSLDTVLAGFAPFGAAIAQLTGAPLIFWQEMKADLRAAQGLIQYTVLNPLLQQAIPGIIPDQTHIDAIWTRTATQVEAWLGAEGVTVDIYDISFMLRRRGAT